MLFKNSGIIEKKENSFGGQHILNNIQSNRKRMSIKRVAGYLDLHIVSHLSKFYIGTVRGGAGNKQKRCSLLPLPFYEARIRY